MQNTESEQQILRLLYHEQFDLAAPIETDLRQWARAEHISEAGLQEILAALIERGLVRATNGPLSCRLSDRGVFWVEDCGLAPTDSATHHFAVRLGMLEALSLFASNRETANGVGALAGRAGLSAVDCRRNLPVLEDAGWTRVNVHGGIEITVKGLQTLHEWRADVRSRISNQRRQA